MTRPRSDRLTLLFDVLFHPGFRQWRQEPGRVHEVSDIRTYVEWARRAEQEVFDGIFFADFVGLRRSQLAAGPVRPFDPFTQAAAVAAATTHLGVVVTGSTLFTHPYDLTRRLSSLDNAAPGRVGWNVVTSFAGEQNFGIDRIPAPEDRYAQAEEFVEVATRLWDSWSPEAKRKQRSGVPVSDRYLEAADVVDIDHVGEHFRVRGALDIPPASVQRPVIFQAGASEPGIAFAARHAEAVFAAAPTLEHAAEYDARLRQALAVAGRDRSDVRVLPGATLVVADSDAEAEEILREPRPDAELLALWDGIREETPPLRERSYTLDDVLPEDWFPSAAQIAVFDRRRSRSELYRRLSEGRSQTLRAFLQQIAERGPHAKIVGSPATIVSEIERWFLSGHVDGFVLISTNDIERLLGEVLPGLRERGLAKTAYTGPTFRDNLGLT